MNGCCYNGIVTIINLTVTPVKETKCCFDKSFLKRVHLFKFQTVNQATCLNMHIPVSINRNDEKRWTNEE